MKSQPGPPLTLGSAAAARDRLIRLVQRLPASGRARSRRDGPAVRPKRPCSLGASGWYPHDPGAGRLIWRWAGLSGARKFLPVPARRRVVDYWRLIWPGYRDWSRRVLVRRRCRWVGWRLRRGAWRLRRAQLLSKGRRDWCAQSTDPFMASMTG